MIQILVLAVIFIVFMAGMIVLYMQGLSSGSGGSTTTIALGATDELLSTAQKKAAEVIVEQNAGHKLEEQESGSSNKPGISDDK